MAQISVKQTVAVPADRLWALLADFGNISWMPAGTTADIEGEGIGMARIIGGAQGIREVLESLDAGTRTLEYSIPENVPFPVTGYRATMKVSASGEGSEFEWSCRFEPDGVEEAQAGAQIEQMYGVMIGWIAEAAAKS